MLTVQLREGQNLSLSSSSSFISGKVKPNVFVLFKFQGNTSESTCKFNTFDPKWTREQYIFPVQRPVTPFGIKSIDTKSASLPNIEDKNRNFSNDPPLHVQIMHRVKTVEQSQSLLLGEADVSVVSVLTGFSNSMDVWVTLPSNGRILLSIFYDGQDDEEPLHPGDLAKLIGFGELKDVFPLLPHEEYEIVQPPSFHLTNQQKISKEGIVVEETANENYDENNIVYIKWKTTEGWENTIEVNKKLLYCVKRHETRLQHVLAAAKKILSHVQEIPVVHYVVEGYQSTGIIGLSKNIFHEMKHTTIRWFQGGLPQIKNDLVFAIGISPSHQIISPNDKQKKKNNSKFNSSNELNSNGENELFRKKINAQKLNIFNKNDNEDKNDKVNDDDDNNNNNNNNDNIQNNLTLISENNSNFQPISFQCPITGEIMIDPVVAADGHTYERSAIELWFKDHETSPLTGEKIPTQLFKNYSLKSAIEEFCTLKK